MAATYSKPTVVPRWADTGTRTEPSELEKDTGWVPLQKPPAEYFNWLGGFTGDWLKWINERLADGPSDANVFSIRNPNDGTRQLQTIVGGGIEIDYGLNVGFAGAAADDTVCIGDGSFCLSNVASEPVIALDTATDRLEFNRTDNVLKLLLGSSDKLTVGPLGLRIGFGASPPTLPFHIAEDIGGTLGGSAGDRRDIASVDYFSDDTIDLLTYAYRHANGTTWTTGSTYIHYSGEAGAERHGFVRFSGSAVASSTYGIAEHVGIGSGVFGAEPALYVDSASVYAHALLPRTYYGLGGSLSSLGSQARPWSTIWMRDSTGTDAHINATGSAAPGKLTLEVFEGVTSRGAVKLIGNAVLASSRVDCTGIGHIDALEVRSRTGDPLSGRGFGLTSGVGTILTSGMFGSPDGEGVRLWRRGYRAVDIFGRSGFESDVQFTLGRGSGAGATVADLREYACVCQDFLSQDAIARADLVRISAAADQSVARTTTLAETGAIGFAVEDIGNGSIGRVATSGIVIARADGAPGVTRGNYVQASGVTGRVQNLATFGPACVGVALKTVAADEYFPLLIRFGG